MINALKGFVKKETVLTISFLLAVISMFFNPPCKEYSGYINYSVIALLFCLMVTVQGFSKLGIFRLCSEKMTGMFSGTRTIACVLVLLCFFMSMLITNDVALLTFVPLTIMLFSGKDKCLIRCIILETAAANLGSMLTPVGNPQNLYLYSHYSMSVFELIKTILPYGVASLIIIMVSLFLIPNEKITAQKSKIDFKADKKLILYSVLLIISLLTVGHFLDYKLCLCATLVLVLIFDRQILKKPDYALLLTFVCFFIFVGNISAISAVESFINSIIDGKEMLVSCLLSQVISNVPCAVMLSGFTENSKGLLIGVNIGGMGTLIASLASLISYKLYVRSEGSHKGRYFAEFTVYNFAVLAILICFAFIL